MNQNLIDQNPMINQFNNYMRNNPTNVPFQGNQLISNNVHVQNNLNNYVQQFKQVKNVPNTITVPSVTIVDNKAEPAHHVEIISQMLKPQKITRDNRDVKSNFEARREVQKKAEKGDIGIAITNTPYKTIIKDKIITKAVKDVKEDDLLVHKSIREIDANIDKFNKEYVKKKNEETEVNEELKIEFHIDNYNKHKKKFEYKESFIRNLAYDQNSAEENKADSIDFYKKKQKEAEEGKKTCDDILKYLEEEGVIREDELPTKEQM